MKKKSLDFKKLTLSKETISILESQQGVVGASGGPSCQFLTCQGNNTCRPVCIPEITKQPGCSAGTASACMPCQSALCF